MTACDIDNIIYLYTHAIIYNYTILLELYVPWRIYYAWRTIWVQFDCMSMWKGTVRWVARGNQKVLHNDAIAYLSLSLLINACCGSVYC